MYTLALTQAELILLLALVNAKVNKQAEFGQKPNAALANVVNKLKGLTQ